MPTIDSADKYRIQGPAISFAEMVKKNPGMRLPIPEARMEEHKVWEAQMQARQEAVHRYAQEHPEKIYGQVVVNGKLFATVWDSGSAQIPGPMPGLTDNAASSLDIAKARLREIAQAVGGTIRYTNFLPLPGGGSESSGAAIPDSFLASLPPITARPFFELDEELLAHLRRSQVEASARLEQKKQAASPDSETGTVQQA